jgi:hypothetical protein
MSEAPSQHLLLTAETIYSSAGYAMPGIMKLVPISGRDAPNVIEFRPRLSKDAARDA